MTVPARERRPDLLDTAAAVLTADPTASLAEIAAAAGMGRTTLHRIFPTREVLLHALAVHAMERLSAAVEAAEPGTGSAPEVLRRFARAVVPLAAELRFLEAGPAVWDLPEMRSGWYEVSATLEEVVDRGKRDGDLRPDVDTVLLVEVMVGAIWAVGEALRDGRIATEGAGDAVADLVLAGAAVPTTARARRRRGTDGDTS